jgi:flagellar basal body-associated protein FliL
MSTTGSGQGGDDVFPLDDLLAEPQDQADGATKVEDGGENATSSPPGAEAATASQNAARASRAKSGRSQSKTAGGILRETDQQLAQIDAALAAEDPGFSHRISELKREKIIADIPADELDVDVEEEADRLAQEPNAARVPRAPRRGVQFKTLIAGLTRAFGGVRQIGQSIGSAPNEVAPDLKTLIHLIKTKGLSVTLAKFKAFALTLKEYGDQIKALPLKSKLSLLGLVGLAVALVLIVGRLRTGHLLPDFEVHFIPSVAAFADQSWTYDEHEEMEDFYSPLLHPEHVVLLDKVIANLRPSEGEGQDSMGLFEFYVEASSQEAAIEINDRRVEINDVVHRTVESITYEEVVTLAGKNKLKLVLRKNLNAVLSKGRIRRVYFKTLVLKP